MEQQPAPAGGLQLPPDVVLWTKYEYTLTLRSSGEGAAQTCVVTWKPDGVDATATLDRWTPDGTAVTVTPEQCRLAQAGLERLAEAMREQAAAGSFGEPSLGVAYVDTTVRAAVQPAPAPAPVPSPIPITPPPVHASRRGPGSSSNSRASSSRSRSASSDRHNRRRHRRPTPSPSPPPRRRRTRSRSASPSIRPDRRTLAPSVAHTAATSRVSVGDRSTAPMRSAPTVDAAASKPPKPRAKPRAATGATVSVKAHPEPKRGAMAAQNQQWQNAWIFGTLPGAA